MKRKHLGLVAAGVVAAVVSLSGVVPALAQDDVTDDPSTDTQRGVCSSGWHWFPLSIETVGFMPVGVTQANYNGTASPAEVTFISNASATMSATASGSLQVGITAKLASANAEFGGNMVASATAGIGVQVKVEVPPGKYGYGEFGIWSNSVRGEEQYWQGIGTVCNITQRTTAYLNAPYHAGWRTWTD